MQPFRDRVDSNNSVDALAGALEHVNIAYDPTCV